MPITQVNPEALTVGLNTKLPEMLPEVLHLNEDDLKFTASSGGEGVELTFADRGLNDNRTRETKYLRCPANGILTQAMVNSDHPVTFIIRNNFNLNGAKITLPKDSVLQFDGGILKNGTLVGNNTTIIAGILKIFEITVKFEGTWSSHGVPVEWFGAESKKFDAEKESLYVINDSALVDSSPAFNSAISLSVLGCGEAWAHGGLYRCCETINILKNSQLNLGSGTALNFHLNGKGLDSNSEPYIALYPNEYIPTDQMAKAIDFDAYNGQLTGHGWIIIKDCTYTIGIYVPGRYYSFTDMQLSCHIDVRIVGGYHGHSAPDPDDNFGEGVPSKDSELTGYYFDKTNRIEYYRSSATAAWGKYRECKVNYNTSIRCDVTQSGSDYRLINTRFSIWDMFGYRGIEIIQKNSSWYNQSIWDGTVSNKISNFVSMFGTNTSYHNMERMSYQNGIERNKYGYYVYSESHGNKFGNVWDNSAVKGNPYSVWFAKESRDESILWCSNAQVRDEGSNNTYGIVNSKKDIYLQSCMSVENTLNMRPPMDNPERKMVYFDEIIDKPLSESLCSNIFTTYTNTNIPISEACVLFDTSYETGLEICNEAHPGGIAIKCVDSPSRVWTGDTGRMRNKALYMRLIFNTMDLPNREYKNIIAEVSTRNIDGLDKSSAAYSTYFHATPPSTWYTNWEMGAGKNTNSIQSMIIPMNGDVFRSLGWLLFIHPLKALSKPIKLIGVEVYSDNFYTSIVKDNAINKPLCPKKGTMYFDTTTNRPNWWNGTDWVDITEPINTAITSKQDKLTSGTNIKTVNNQSLLGSGNITIEASKITVDTELSDTSTNPVQNLVIKKYIDDTLGTINTQLSRI